MFIKYIKKKKFGFIILIILVVALCILIFFSRGVSLSAKLSDGVNLPVIMYHSVLKNPSQASEFIISPKQLEQDLIYLRQHGYQAISCQQLVDYVYHDGSLPAKPVLLTFDDGYLNNITYVFPLLKKYQMSAVFFVVGSLTELYSEINDLNPNYAYMNWQNIKTAVLDDYIEIGNHTYDMHKHDDRRGCCKKVNESVEQYQEKLQLDIGSLQNKLKVNCDLDCIAFAYPYGEISPDSLPVIKDLGFLLSFSTYEKVNKVFHNPEDLFLLGRFNRDSRLSTEQFMKKIL